MRIFDIVLFHHDLLSAVQDVGVHFLDYEAERILVALEHVVEEFELIKVLLLKHVDASGIF